MTDSQDDFKDIAISGARSAPDLYEPTVIIKQRPNPFTRADDAGYKLLLVYADDRRNDGTYHTIDENRADAEEKLIEAIYYHMALPVVRKPGFTP